MDGNELTMIFVTFFAIWGAFEIHSCAVEQDTPEYKAKQVAELKDCNTPKLFSSAGGVDLYVVSPNCGRRVYFSKSGTHTTYTERHGKTSETVDDDVSNTEGK